VEEGGIAIKTEGGGMGVATIGLKAAKMEDSTIGMGLKRKRSEEGARQLQLSCVCQKGQCPQCHQCRKVTCAARPCICGGNGNKLKIAPGGQLVEKEWLPGSVRALPTWRGSLTVGLCQHGRRRIHCKVCVPPCEKCRQKRHLCTCSKYDLHQSGLGYHHFENLMTSSALSSSAASGNDARGNRGDSQETKGQSNGRAKPCMPTKRKFIQVRAGAHLSFASMPLSSLPYQAMPPPPFEPPPSKSEKATAPPSKGTLTKEWGDEMD
jgi:hypothetical protein